MYKILNIISDTNIGGAGTLLLTFLSHFNREQFEAVVVLPKGSLLLPHIQAKGIKAIEIDNIADKSFKVAAISDILHILKDEKPHIVHSHAVLSARVAARMYRKCKIIHTRHSVYQKQEFGQESKFKKSFLYRGLFGNLNSMLSDIIIATSPAAKIHMEQTGSKSKKIKMIYNGVEPLEKPNEKERAALRFKYGILPDDFVCSMVARLEPVKGHEYVIKAAGMLEREEGKNIKFIFAGTGSIELELKQMVADLGIKNIIFTGFIENIQEIHKLSDLQINASFSETSNQALLEGMSIGVPAIATDAGGNSYLINDGINGILFDIGDYGSLYKAILELKENKKLYSQLSEKSLEIFKERFTAEAMVTNIENTYRGLLNG